MMPTGIKVPEKSATNDISITTALTVFLSGKGGIKSVINDDGQAV